jgi:hypothetical protein
MGTSQCNYTSNQFHGAGSISVADNGSAGQEIPLVYPKAYFHVHKTRHWTTS